AWLIKTVTSLLLLVAFIAVSNDALKDPLAAKPLYSAWRLADILLCSSSLTEVTRATTQNSPPVLRDRTNMSPKAFLKSALFFATGSASGARRNPCPRRIALWTSHRPAIKDEKELTALLCAKSNFAPPENNP